MSNLESRKFLVSRSVPYEKSTFTVPRPPSRRYTPWRVRLCSLTVDYMTDGFKVTGSSVHWSLFINPVSWVKWCLELFLLQLYGEILDTTRKCM